MLFFRWNGIIEATCSIKRLPVRRSPNYSTLKLGSLILAVNNLSQVYSSVVWNSSRRPQVGLPPHTQLAAVQVQPFLAQRIVFAARIGGTDLSHFKAQSKHAFVALSLPFSFSNIPFLLTIKKNTRTAHHSWWATIHKTVAYFCPWPVLNQVPYTSAGGK